MLFSRISKNLRGSFNSCRWFRSIGDHNHCFLSPHNFHSRGGDSTQQVFSFRPFCFLLNMRHFWDPSLVVVRFKVPNFIAFALAPFGTLSAIWHSGSLLSEFSVDKHERNELSLLGNKLRAMVVAEVPKLASAAEYFFKMGVEGKRFRPTVLLLMSTALNLPIHEAPPPIEIGGTLTTDVRLRQQRIAEITEMIHVASLLHDDVLDDADTRRGIGSLNFVMGNKLAVLAGDFLLSRACVALASLKNTEVVSLLAKVVEHLVTGETMQMTTTSDQRCSMEYYMQKTYYKTASLISNSCKAIAILAGQTAEVAMLAFEYGKNLGLAFQLIDDVLDFTGTSASLGKGSLSDIRHGIVTAPILFAMEEFPQLRAIVDEGFENPANVDLALEYLGKSRGIQRTRELAVEHANLAAAAIDSLPENDDEDVRKSRKALIDLTHRVITRTKLGVGRRAEEQAQCATATGFASSTGETGPC
ncbi:hypothetical protein JHK82_047740 [Glycine max]|nr:hypothetical protein JHK86_047627 [Glycine max]KAG4943597.1 hypothetical protein JHK85_048243 [Glycine max]KAG5097886.1 hypothetical protein JHK82_047740 [Glycine max]